MDMNTKTSQWIMGEPPKRFSLSSGQAIILVAVSMIALLAIVGLAIDGGRLLLLKRDSQNANDAAVLAATFALCTGGTESQILNAGLTSASANGFTNGEENTTVTIDPDPAGLDEDICSECTVEVVITREIDPYFIQLVYQGQLEVTTRAVGSCIPNSVPIEIDSDGDGIPDSEEPQLAAFWGGALPGECEQPAVDLAGSDMIIKGNLHSNSELDMNPNNQAGDVDCDNLPDPLGSGAFTFGTITYGTDADNFQDSKSANCDWDQAPGEDPEPVVCGADCLTNNNDGVDNDNDAEQVDPYTDADGDILWPVDYDIEDYRPAGSIATDLNDDADPALDQYFYFDPTIDSTDPAVTGNTCGKNDKAQVTDIPSTFWDGGTVGGTLLGGVYYSKCHWDIDGDDVTDGTATFVAEGKISVNHEMDLTAFHDDLLFFANGPAPNDDTVFPDNGPSCTNDGIHISSSDSNFTGIIFGPNGNVQFSASSNNASLFGCIIGYTTKNSSSGLEITCDPGESNTRGAIGISE
jgi:hypothetical protein